MPGVRAILRAADFLANASNLSDGKRLETHATQVSNGAALSNFVWYATFLGACFASALTATESWKIPVACLMAIGITALAPLFAGVIQPPIFQFLTAGVVMALIGSSFEMSPRQLAGGLSGALMLGAPVLLWTL